MQTRSLIRHFHWFYLTLSLAYLLAYALTRSYADSWMPEFALILCGISAACTLSMYCALHYEDQWFGRIFVGTAYCAPGLYIAYLLTANPSSGAVNPSLLEGVAAGVFVIAAAVRPTVWFVSGFLAGYYIRNIIVWISIYQQMEVKAPSIAVTYAFIKSWTAIADTKAHLWLPIEVGLAGWILYHGVHWVMRRTDSPLDRVV